MKTKLSRGQFGLILFVLGSALMVISSLMPEARQSIDVVPQPAPVFTPSPTPRVRAKLCTGPVVSDDQVALQVITADRYGRGLNRGMLVWNYDLNSPKGEFEFSMIYGALDPRDSCGFEIIFLKGSRVAYALKRVSPHQFAVQPIPLLGVPFGNIDVDLTDDDGVIIKYRGTDGQEFSEGIVLENYFPVG